MDVPHIGLVANNGAVSFDELVRLARALQKQVIQNFAPIWGVTATVTAFPDSSRFDPNSWPIIFATDIAPGDGGYHLTTSGRPTAFVQAGPWHSVVASHECLEMVLDPYGQTRIPGLVPGGVHPVQYLLEICDPCVAPNFAYPIDGVWVSDFVTRDYYQPRPGATQFSFAGRITSAGQVLPYGYVTWFDPAQGEWFQNRADPGGVVVTRSLGNQIDLSHLPARESVDRETVLTFEDFVLDTTAEGMRALHACSHEAGLSQTGIMLREIIDGRLHRKDKRAPRRSRKKLRENFNHAGESRSRQP